eukprot:11026682-Lingulodinium_polyedra.AAC.1
MHPSHGRTNNRNATTTHHYSLPLSTSHYYSLLLTATLDDPPRLGTAWCYSVLLNTAHWGSRPPATTHYNSLRTSNHCL